MSAGPSGKNATLAAAALLGGIAVSLAPPMRAMELEAGTAWPEPVVRTVALGRAFAAADVTWIRTVQVIGSPAARAQGLPHLESWLDVVTQLDPRFDLPYYFGVLLLVTDAARAQKVDALLARGELAFPEQFQLTMYRGFLAHFGTFDVPRAAQFYRAAASKHGAPAFLRDLATRLEREGNTCGDVVEQLKQFSGRARGSEDRAVADANDQIHTHCLRLHIERAATAWRVTHEGGTPTIDDLQKAGLVGTDLAAPTGQCWSLDTSQKAALIPCRPVRVP